MRWQHTQCPVCRRMLVHRHGAAILHCPACHSLINLLAHPSTPGQTECPSCTMLLHHQLGPPFVHCHYCGVTVATPIRYYQCRGCALYLFYSTTLQTVVCPVCYALEPPILSPSARPQFFPPLMPNAPPRPPPRLPPRRRYSWLHHAHMQPQLLSSTPQLQPSHIILSPAPSIPPPLPPPPSADETQHRPSQPSSPQTSVVNPPLDTETQPTS